MIIALILILTAVALFLIFRDDHDRSYTRNEPKSGRENGRKSIYQKSAAPRRNAPVSRKPDDPHTPYLHIHITASRRDYSCVGGHLLRARINGACELVVQDFWEATLDRYFDPQTGLNLYKL